MANASSKARVLVVLLLGLLVAATPTAMAAGAPSRAPTGNDRQSNLAKAYWTCKTVSMSVKTGDVKSKKAAVCPPSNVKNLKFTPVPNSSKGKNQPEPKSSCGLNVGATILQSGILKANVTYFCSGMAPPWWVQTRFERSSWSGYRPYSQWVSDGTKFGSSGSGGGTANTRCGQGRPGSYTYHASTEAIEYPGVPVNSRDGAASPKYSCGTGMS